jgi:class 3 adenylate cyclase/sugar lactone lactonase YvrE
VQPDGTRIRRRGTAGTKTFLFSDLRDYTTFVETHGDAEAARLLTEYRTLVRREVARHQGAEVKTEGDSFYVVFDAASTALDCAIAILKRAKVRADGRLRIGIGLHAGETVAYDDQFVGSAVNIASRLASTAGPGELIVSDTLRGLVRTTTATPMTDRGPLALKGVAEPIRAWTVRWDPDAAASPTPAIALPLPAARRRRLAPVWAIAAVAAIAAIGATLLLAPRGTSPAPPADAASKPRLVVVAGLGTLGFSGDGGPAVAAQLDEPVSLAFDAGGALFVADSTHQLNAQGVREPYTRIRRIDRNGNILTIAGGGSAEFPFDGSAARAHFPSSAVLAIAPGGPLYVAGGGDPASPQFVATIGGTDELRIVAGGARSGSSGDGGPASRALLFRPNAIAFDAVGGIYVSDGGNNRIRVITRDGSIDAFAGNGARGSTGDDGPAREASFFAPLGVAFSPDGSLFIADTNNHRIRKIDHGGNVVAVAGTGAPGFSGDGGPATSAALNLPSGLTFDRAGNLYIADTGNDRVRRVTPEGTITTIAGGSDADRLVRPAAVVIDAAGGLLIADAGAHRVVRLALR